MKNNKPQKNNNFQHYFVETKPSENDFFVFSDKFEGKTYTFKSSKNVFSKNEIDQGSAALLRGILKNTTSLSGRVLDFGCGTGVLGIVLKNHYPQTHWTLIDINGNAVQLAKENVLLNGFSYRYFNIVKSDLLKSLPGEVFDHVVTNPPIRAGKNVLLGVVKSSYEALEKGGTLTLVIRKSHGAESLKTFITQLFGNCEVIYREKGHYVLHAVKN